MTAMDSDDDVIFDNQGRAYRNYWQGAERIEDWDELLDVAEDVRKELESWNVIDQ